MNKTTIVPQQQRRAWVSPAVQKIRAGEAEHAFGTGGDGTFTTS